MQNLEDFSRERRILVIFEERVYEDFNKPVVLATHFINPLLHFRGIFALFSCARYLAERVMHLFDLGHFYYK